MLRQFITASVIALISTSALADSIIATGSTAKPNSVSYIGYDSFDAQGNPVCTPCLEKTAEEAAREKAYAERRARSREYMARLQGNAVPTDSLLAARASELMASGDATPDKPKPEAANTPLRAGMN
ncbi:hypothetical protein [Phyllobacterium sp. YR531]|uniref:hypothetical protein n=1 Tax=Phyllobacterium sp. YR531 TaxID=1144343 RepID=UPI00026FC3B6|nr:hypothetical protein [Phyllobacterium sp. YR531]EJN03032.1 hypothetical protein PMI41_02578 [Phyllobacterium sp. YR531]